jgi:hypothetical protein
MKIARVRLECMVQACRFNVAGECMCESPALVIVSPTAAECRTFSDKSDTSYPDYDEYAGDANAAM